MTRRDKLVEKVRRQPPEADFDDVRKVLERFGWTLDRESGSHVTFVSKDAPTITIPKKHGGTVKREYLKKICEILGLDD